MSVKNTIHTFLWPEKSKRAFILMPSKRDDPPMLFLISGTYLDFNSHSVVAEGYVIPDTSIIGKGSNVVGIITVGENVMKFWRSALPALAERCRTWQHKNSCEYTREFHAQEEKSLSLCSCGLGKFGKDFADEKSWQKFAPYVTRIAISTIFTSPYLQDTRRFHRMASEYWYPFPITDQIFANEAKCIVCWKQEANNMCGRCGKPRYCSKNSQKRDWQEHKKSCSI